MTYARVLLIGGPLQGDADPLARLRLALRAAGHAATLIDEPGGPDAQEARAFIRSFRPTLVLWDGRQGAPDAGTARELRVSGALSVILWPGDEDAASLLDAFVPAFSHPGAPDAGTARELGSGRHGASAIPLVAAPDRAYARALTSAPDEARDGVFCTQKATGGRRDVLREAGILEGPFVGFDPSWGERSGDPSCSSLAYAARRSEACVLFDGPDAPSPLEAALRMAEGAAVFAESSLVSRWEDRGLARAVRAFESAKELRDGLRGIEGEAKGQRSFLSARMPLDDALAGFLAACDDLAASLGRAPVLSMDRPAREILLYGWFGMRNFGDDLLLMTAMDRMAGRWPEAHFVAVGGNAAEVRRSFGVEAYSPDRRYEIRAALRRCAGAAFFGGLVFDDPMQETAGDIELFMDPWIEPTGQAAVCLEAWLSGVPAVYLGAGAGPLAKPAARNAARVMGLSGARFVLRDGHSARLLEGAGVPAGQIAVKADLVLGAASLFEGLENAPLPEGLERGAYLAVSLRDWPLVPEGFEREVAAALDETFRKTGLKAAFVPFGAEDVEIHRRTASLMEEPGAAVVLGERPGEEEILRLVEGSKAAFAMRLHCSILHHVLGKPAVGLDYNDKILAHFEGVGQAEMLLPLSASASDMADAVSHVVGGYAEACSRVRRGVEEGAALANEAFEDFFETVESSPRRDPEPECFHPRGRSFAWTVVAERDAELARVREEADAQRLRAERAERTLDEVRNSRSFRLGHAVMKPLRRLAGRK